MNLPTKKKHTDEQILNLLDNDPEEGVRLLMEQSMGLLWSACRLYLENPEDVRECIQDTFLDFYENRDRFYPEKGTLNAYLYVIAKRKALRKAKQNEWYDLKLPEEELTGAQDEAEQILNRVMLEQALSSLREEDCRMIRMKYYDGMTCAEIARSMGLPLETVKKRQQRSLKKLHRILIALAVLGILTACAAAAVYRFRFSPATGFQSMDGDVWYEMSDAPVTIGTVYGDVTVGSLLWEDRKLYLTAEFSDPDLDTEQVGEAFLLIDPDTERECKSGNYSTRKGGGLPIHMEQVWPVSDAEEQYCFRIFGEEHTFYMKPIESYESFRQVGQSQTHGGRTIVVRTSREEGRFLADAYVHSEDSWEMIRFGDLYDTDWSSRELLDERVFHYETEGGQPDALEIKTTVLQYTGEIPLIEIPIPEDFMAVDLPFSAGEDTYRITKISWSRGTYEWTEVDEEGQETRRQGDELLIEIAPERLEADTRLIGVSGDLGLVHTYWRYRVNEETGKLDAVGSTESFQRRWHYGGFGYPMETVIRIPVTEPEELPESAYLQITALYKYWDQKFSFSL